jgi:hypothetical protein
MNTHELIIKLPILIPKEFDEDITTEQFISSLKELYQNNPQELFHSLYYELVVSKKNYHIEINQINDHTHHSFQ